MHRTLPASGRASLLCLTLARVPSVAFPHITCELALLALRLYTGTRVWSPRPSVVDSLRMARFLAPLLLLTAAARAVNISCQIFEETMVCDSEKDLVHRGEIRTCSG
jgi:hypothetical protein